MPFCNRDGQPLHYLDQGHGPVVLLGSSYLWDHTMWAPQIEALSRHYRVIAMDLWGHGENQAAARGADLAGRPGSPGVGLDGCVQVTTADLVGLGGMWGARLALAARRDP